MLKGLWAENDVSNFFFFETETRISITKKLNYNRTQTHKERKNDINHFIFWPYPTAKLAEA